MGKTTWYSDDFFTAFKVLDTNEIWEIINEHKDDFEMILYINFGSVKLDEICAYLSITHENFKRRMLHLMEKCLG